MDIRSVARSPFAGRRDEMKNKPKKTTLAALRSARDKANSRGPSPGARKVPESLSVEENGLPTITFPIVGIGASAGGLDAFTQLLKSLPKDTGMAFVLLQHLDPLHESALTELLRRATVMRVQEVTDKLRVEPNQVYVIPPNKRMEIRRGVLALEPREKYARGEQHLIDAFLESLARDQCERAIGVILSGTASDGSLGLEAIKAEGGITFAQDKSAKFDAMPRSAVETGCVDFVLSPVEIGKELARIARHPMIAAAPKDLVAFHAEKERDADQRDGPK